MLEKFTGFGFKNRTSDEFSVYSVTSGSTYERSMFAEFEDKEEAVEGQEGSYYFGTNMRTKPLNLTLYMANIDRNTYLDLQDWLSPNNGLGDFWLYEEPYKYYRNVKVVSSIDYGLYPFENADTGANIYNAELPVTLKSYDPYSYSFVNTKEEGDANGYFDGWDEGTGILPANYTLPTSFIGITSPTEIKVYNGGNARTKPIITINGVSDLLAVTNVNNADSFSISAITDQTFVIDCVKGQITEDDSLVVGRFSGGFINLEPSKRPYITQMTFTNGSNQATSTEDLPQSLVGRELVTHDGTDQFNSNIDLLVDVNTIQLENNFDGVSGAYDVYIIDVNRIIIGGNNLNVDFQFEFPYAYK